MSEPLGYKGSKHYSQLISEIRVIVHDGSFIVQAKLPFRRGYLKVWYGVDNNETLRDTSVKYVDTWSTAKKAEGFAQDFSERLARTRQQIEKRVKEGTVMSTFEIKTLESDPEFFI